MINSTRFRGFLGFVAATLVTPAVAQQETPTFLEEIVVTSTKRESTLQEVPVAVSVVTANELKQSQVLDIKDLQFLVPSLRITQLQSSGNTNFLIRGFGNGANNAGIEPSVGVFIDGVYRSRSASTINDLPNLERIEVLRGPQSTLFGKNASAGVISVITAKPGLDEVNGSASLTVGDYNQYIVKADINGPVSDWVGFSLSGNYNQRDGYYDNLAGGAPLGELNRYGVRGQLLFVPSDALEVRVIADYDKFDEACCGVANLLDGPTGDFVRAVGGNFIPNAPFAYQGYYDFTPVNVFETSGLSMQIDYDINDAVTLTSITALRNLDRFDNVDIDFTSAALLDPETANRTEADIDTFTQELRLSGSTDNMGWMVGGYFFDEEVDQTTGVLYGTDFRAYADILTQGSLQLFELFNALAPGTLFAAGQGLIDVSTMDNQAFSIFSQVDIDLGDRATLTLGANYTEDEKDVTFDSTGTDVFSQLPRSAFEQVGAFLILGQLEAADPGNPANGPTAAFLSTIDCPPPTGIPACNPVLAAQSFQFLKPNLNFPNSVEPGKSKDDATTWTVRLAFDLTDDMSVYASAGTGFKATSWNLSRDSRPFPEDQAAIEAAGLSFPVLTYTTRFAKPEDSTVYEIGMKARWNTVAVNLAVFNQEIENFQSNIFTGNGFNLNNAGKQSTDGLEVDFRWAPTESFEGTFAATLLDPVFDSFTSGEGIASDGSPAVVDLSGTQPPGIHEVSITTTGTYNFKIGNAAAFVRAEYIYEDEVRVIENVPADVASREVGTMNASFGLSWDNGFEAMLWGRNINNDEYLLSAFPSVAQNNPCCSYSGYPNQPRTYGLTVRKYFD